MISISVCMIVKNEGERISRCLNSLKSIADEIIIADTGSTDNTKEIAGNYTDKIYDFPWNGSFADARNFVFSKASCDYIYSADADEELDEDNIRRFNQLKLVLLPEIDIVQMYYCNQLENNTIYNYDRELRPKLYRRLRNFVWEENIHEAVRLDPIIYDSEIEIIHRPGPGHADRDLSAFEKIVASGEILSARLVEIYCKELYISGRDIHFLNAKKYFQELAEGELLNEYLGPGILAICARACRISGDETGFLKYVTRSSAGQMMCSEICCELADYFMEKGDENEAKMWYVNALNETESALDIRYGDEIPRRFLTQRQVMV